MNFFSEHGKGEGLQKNAEMAEEAGIVPPDDPVPSEEQPRLDEKSKITCPKCIASSRTKLKLIIRIEAAKYAAKSGITQRQFRSSSKRR